jgi:pyruvate/2-oxoglutarate dehydrogenase complex dihydrolipoamide dehydrogenase (E3) component
MGVDAIVIGGGPAGEVRAGALADLLTDLVNG